MDFFPPAPGHFAQKTVIISTGFHILKKDQEEEMTEVTWERTGVAWVALVLENEGARAHAEWVLTKASWGSSYLELHFIVSF